MSRKQLLIYGLAVLCAATLLSCSLDPRALEPVVSESGIAGTVTRVAASGSGDLSGDVKSDAYNDHAIGDETPVQGGQVVVQFLAEPDSLNPFTDGSAVNSYINEYLFSTLIRQNPETFDWEGAWPSAGWKRMLSSRRTEASCGGRLLSADRETRGTLCS